VLGCASLGPSQGLPSHSTPPIHPHTSIHTSAGILPPLEMGPLMFAVLGLATLLKLPLWWYCDGLKRYSGAAEALAEDHINVRVGPAWLWGRRRGGATAHMQATLHDGFANASTIVTVRLPSCQLWSSPSTHLQPHLCAHPAGRVCQCWCHCDRRSGRPLQAVLVGRSGWRHPHFVDHCVALGSHHIQLGGQSGEECGSVGGGWVAAWLRGCVAAWLRGCVAAVASTGLCATYSTPIPSPAQPNPTHPMFWHPTPLTPGGRDGCRRRHAPDPKGGHALPCSAMLCCAVLCCVLLCCAVACYIVLRHAILKPYLPPLLGAG